jgi:hypothetical protein
MYRRGIPRRRHKYERQSFMSVKSVSHLLTSATKPKQEAVLGVFRNETSIESYINITAEEYERKVSPVGCYEETVLALEQNRSNATSIDIGTGKESTVYFYWNSICITMLSL